jgi:hypothetical protein
MATRRPTHRDRDSVSDQRALKSSQLEIEVRETLRRLLVTMPGTRYGMEFGDVNGRLALLSGFGPNDKSAPITAREFAALAERAAKKKALELGWSARRAGSKAWIDKAPKR